MPDRSTDSRPGQHRRLERDAGEPNPTQGSAARVGQETGPTTAPGGAEHLLMGREPPSAPRVTQPLEDELEESDPGTADHDQPAEGGRAEAEDG
jgi:hypothetical protein